ncbi:MAG: hypothetical protein ACOYXR_03295 [Nitrospirota bacterium]
MRPFNRPPNRKGPKRGPQHQGQRPGRPQSRGGNQRPQAPAGPSGPPSARAAAIDPFQLFCSYYLGIAADKRYAPANIHEVGRRFGVDAGVIRQVLKEHGMDPESVMNTEFDLAMAQIDIQVAPEGVDRLELAKGIYQEFRAAPRKPRDWRRMLEDDARENAKIFGRRD